MYHFLIKNKNKNKERKQDKILQRCKNMLERIKVRISDYKAKKEFKQLRQAKNRLTKDIEKSGYNELYTAQLEKIFNTVKSVM